MSSSRNKLLLGVLLAIATASIVTPAQAQGYIKVGDTLYPDVVLPSPMEFNGPLSAIMPVCCPTGLNVLSSAAIIDRGIGGVMVGGIQRHPADVSPFGLLHPNNAAARIFDYMNGP